MEDANGDVLPTNGSVTTVYRWPLNAVSTDVDAMIDENQLLQAMTAIDNAVKKQFFIG
jgi:hypothetical protein